MIIIHIRSEKSTFFVASQILGILPNKRSVNSINNVIFDEVSGLLKEFPKTSEVSGCQFDTSNA